MGKPIACLTPAFRKLQTIKVDKETGLPKYELEPDYKVLVDVQKKKFIGDSLNCLIDNMFNLRAAKKALEDSAKTIGIELEAIGQLILERFGEDDIRKLTTEDGKTVFAKSTAYPNVQDKSKLFAWIKKHNAAHLLSVNPQSLKAVTNERLKNGESLPDGVKVFIKDSVGFRSPGESNGGTE